MEETDSCVVNKRLSGIYLALPTNTKMPVTSTLDSINFDV